MKRNQMAGLAFGVIVAVGIIVGCSRNSDDDDNGSAASEDSSGGGGGGRGGGGGTGTVPPPGAVRQADLRAGDAAAEVVDATAIPVADFSAAGRVMNRGDAASGPCRVEIYATSTGMIPRVMGVIGSVDVASLEAGADAAIALTAPFPVLPPGVYEIGWFIDADFVVAESDEGNNAVLMADTVLVLDAFEPNDTQAAAAPFAVGLSAARVEGAISLAGDEDWFEIENRPGLVHSISLTTLPADYDLEVYAEDGTVLDSSVTVGIVDESIEWTPAAPGASYVRIFSTSGASDPAGRWTLLFARP